MKRLMKYYLNTVKKANTANGVLKKREKKRKFKIPNMIVHYI